MLPIMPARLCCLVFAIALVGSIPAQADVQFDVIGPGYHPRLQADEVGRLHLLLHDGDRLYYRAYVGGLWSAAEEVPGSAGVPGHKFTRGRMFVSPDGERVAVSWGTGYDTDIQFAQRIGGAWSGPETACSADVRAWEYTAVALSGAGDAYVLCMFDDLWVAHRDPAGTWDGPHHQWTEWGKHVAVVADDQGQFHGVFRFSRVRYFRGDGAAWTGPWDASTATGSAELPALIIGPEGQPHIAWQQWIDDGGWEPVSVRYATGLDDSWTNDGEGVVVAEPSRVFNPPELAVDPDGHVLVTWIEDHDLQLAWSTDGGVSFPAPQLLATDAQPVQDGNLEHDLATAPVVIVDGHVHIVYEDDQRQLIHVTGLVTTPVGDDDDDAADDDDAGDDDDATGDDDDGADDDVAGDDDGEHDGGEGGGCSCRQDEPARGTNLLILVALVLLVVCYSRQ